MAVINLSAETLTAGVAAALERSGATSPTAQSMASAVLAAELDGIASHGLAYVPIYCQHVECGKVNGQAKPDLKTIKPATARVDADCGFAHPAIDLALPHLKTAAQQHGIASVTIFNSYNCGVLGHHTERIAQSGLIGLGFTNAPASIAPVGGKRPVIGTNPYSLAIPDLATGELRLLIDQSASVVAKSEVSAHKRRNESLPPGWALDARGQPTTDPDEALAGSMVPAGGAKGFNTGLMTEMLAAILAGAHLGIDASPFAGTQGGPPKTGQCFIAIDPNAFGENQFAAQLNRLLDAVAAEPEVRIPGERRQKNRQHFAQHGLRADSDLWKNITMSNQ